MAVEQDCLDYVSAVQWYCNTKTHETYSCGEAIKTNDTSIRQNILLASSIRPIHRIFIALHLVLAIHLPNATQISQ